MHYSIGFEQGFDEEFICSPANVRWGGTPLQDAVGSGHVQVASVLKSKGGIMPESLGAVQMCEAASDGDVRRLKLLVECAGIQATYIQIF